MGVWIYPSIHLQNLIHELKRLESGLVFLREEAWRNFEQSLNLPALGLAEGSLIKAIKGSLLHLPDPSQAFPLVFYFPFPHVVDRDGVHSPQANSRRAQPVPAAHKPPQREVP